MKYFLMSGVLLVILGLYLDSLVPPDIVEHRARVVAFNSLFSLIYGTLTLLEEYGSYTFLDVLNFLPLPPPVYNNSFVTSYDDIIAEVQARIYIPVNKNEDSAMIIYFHGGGFAYGSVDTHHSTVVDLCNRTNAVIVSVNYRLAPDSPFPAGHEDSLAVTKHVMENLEKYGIVSNRIFTAGDSAGGNLATAIDGELAKDHLKLTGAILITPVLQVATTALPSYSSKSFMFLRNRLMSNFIANVFAVPAKPNWRTVQQNRYVCSDKRSQQIYSTYLPGVKVPDSCDAQLYKQMQQIYDPRISPLFRKSLSDLSPTLVLVAEVDVLHDEALLYYKRLQKEGVPSELKIYKGAYHAFFSEIGMLTLPTQYEVIMNDIVKFIKDN